MHPPTTKEGNLRLEPRRYCRVTPSCHHLITRMEHKQRELLHVCGGVVAWCGDGREEGGDPHDGPAVGFVVGDNIGGEDGGKVREAGDCVGVPEVKPGCGEGGGFGLGEAVGDGTWSVCGSEGEEDEGEERGEEEHPGSRGKAGER